MKPALPTHFRTNRKAMGYKIKEMYYTIQGEGFHTGRPAVFCRFAGCNLWSGHEKDRKDAVCDFCDTDFVGTSGPGGGEFHYAEDLASFAQNLWPESVNAKPFIVCTGGEPLLQMDDAVINSLHENGFEIAIETNGTLIPPEGIDWVCVSPKANADFILQQGDELKIVYPQPGMDPAMHKDLEFDHFSLQPMDGPNLKKNIDRTVQYCLKHPQWRMSLQTHKFLEIP